MRGFFAKHWRSVSVALVINLPSLWRGLIWVWDWAARLDFVATHARDLAEVGSMISFLINPPPWMIFVTSAVGVLVVLWDVRRPREGARNIEQDRMAFLIGGMVVCIAGAIIFGVLAFQRYRTLPAESSQIANSPVLDTSPAPAPAPVPAARPSENEQRRMLLESRHRLELAAANASGAPLRHEFASNGLGILEVQSGSDTLKVHISKSGATSMWIYSRDSTIKRLSITRDNEHGKTIDIRQLRPVRDAGSMEIGDHAFIETNNAVIQFVLTGVLFYNSGDNTDEVRLRYKTYDQDTFLIELL